jgi:LacI family transcriptional regulator
VSLLAKIAVGRSGSASMPVAAARAGSNVKSPAVLGVAVSDHHYQYQFAYEFALGAASDLLRLPNQPTAIFAASDVLAMGVYEAARRAGLRVPEDLSVVGFDDVPMAQWVSPPLTTLRQPLAEMATLATRTLLNGESTGIQQRVELATSLIVRASTQPLEQQPAGRRRGKD